MKADEAVPPALRIAGAYSWRILLVVGVIAVLFFLIAQLKDIVVPFLVAILVAALLVPLVQFLTRHGWPKWLAVALAMLGTIAIVAGLIFVIVSQIRGGYPDLQVRSVRAFNDFKEFLAASPLQLDDAQLQAYVDQAVAALQKDSQALVSGALSVGTTAGHVAAGLFLTLFATLFILIDGKGIWAWIVRLFPEGPHRRLRRGACRLGHTDQLREGADLRGVRGCRGHRRRGVGTRVLLRAGLPAGAPDRDRRVPRFVHPRGRRGADRHHRGVRRPGLPRPARRPSSCSAW